MSCYPEHKLIRTILGFLNSSICRSLLAAINPTINYQVGDIERLPVPAGSSPTIDKLVSECVELAQQETREIETTYHFVGPLRSLSDRTVRNERLASLESAINTEVLRLYGLAETDVTAIDADVNHDANDISEDSPEPGDIVDNEGNDELQKTESAVDWAQSWISYAVGVILGRFRLGQPAGLGRGDFAENIIAEVGKLGDSDSILVSDPGHHDDLTLKVLTALGLMLGHEAAVEIIRTGAGSSEDPELALRKYLEKSFFVEHLKLYDKRPIYWYLQTPKKRYAIWIFHERLTRDTLYRIQTEYVEPRLRHSESKMKEMRDKAVLAETRERRSLEKQISSEAEFYDDLQEFETRLRRIIERGYAPHIDDGVLINASPIHEIFPAYPDCAKACRDLMAGKYDWAKQAMEYRPAEVKEVCKRNKSYAIAHGLS
jgi:hypothetical protein